jgi:hypothetical protein
LAEIFVESPVDREVAGSTKICVFLASLPPLLAPLEQIPDATLVPSTIAIEGTQVDVEDPIADKRNDFLSLVFRPFPLPIFATTGPRHVCVPLEVATTPHRSVRIEKRKQKRKEATTQGFFMRTLRLLEKNTE